MFGKWVILTGKNMFVYECDIVTDSICKPITGDYS